MRISTQWPKSVTLTVAGVLLALGLTGRTRAADAGPLYGFSTSGSKTEIQREADFRAIPKPDKLREYMQKLSARPHHVGSPYDKANAEWIRDQMKAWGWDSTIETFEVLFPTPKTRVLEMIEPVHFTALLQ